MKHIHVFKGNLRNTFKIESKDYIVSFFIFIITFLCFYIPFHPYFFGDELISHRLAVTNNYSFFKIFHDLNLYKPRLVFNAIQALLAATHAPRFLYFLIISSCAIWINIFLYIFVRRFLKGTLYTAVLMVLVTLTSRFGIMIYFDYVAGVIESVSTSFFVLFLLFVYWAKEKKASNLLFFCALLAAFGSTFVHERYAFGIAGLSFGILILELVRPSKNKKMVVIWSITFCLLPALIFFLMNRFIGAYSILIGSASRNIKINLETIVVFLTYVFNVFFGGNIGQSWYWGSANIGTKLGKVLALLEILSLISAYLYIIKKKGILRRNAKYCFSLSLSAIGFIFITSLTGFEIFDARFMFPVSIVASMIFILLIDRKHQSIPLFVVLLFSIIYIQVKSQNAIAYISASRAAKAISQSINTIVPSGSNGLSIGNGQDDWTIGGGYAVDMGDRRGATFSMLNLRQNIEIDPLIDGAEYDAKRYDFSIAFVGYDTEGGPIYKYLPVEKARVLSGENSITSMSVKKVVGDETTWKSWSWGSGIAYSKDGVILHAGVNGFFPIPAPDLKDKVIVYYARSIKDAKTKMRIQINWHSANGSYINTFIKVVEVGKEWQYHYSDYSVPENAAIGNVYVQLAENNSSDVEIKSIDLR